MPEIRGRLLADLHPNGTVRLVFIAHTGGGHMILHRNGVENRKFRMDTVNPKLPVSLMSLTIRCAFCC